MTDTALASRLVLGSVVATVDAVAGEVTLEREAISRKQVAVADRIVLSKLDLTGEVEDSLHNRLTSLNPRAPTSRAVYGRIESDNLFGVALHDPKARVLDVNSWLAEAPEHDHSAHDAEIKSFTVVRVEPIQAVALTLFLEALAEHCGADLLRLKGIVNVAESPQRPAVIHGVQHVFHAPAWLRHWPSDDRTSRMVLITRRIRREWVEVLLDAISAEVAEVSPGSRHRRARGSV
jgi:G3E family GTPase